VLSLCFARLVGVFSHRFCVCLPAPLSYVQVAGVPAAGLRAAGASGLTSEGVWRLSPSSLYPPYRPVPCICAGWCVCVLSPLGRLFFPLLRWIRMPVCLRSGCEPRGGTGGALLQ
jgi:hypothetical protein